VHGFVDGITIPPMVFAPVCPFFTQKQRCPQQLRQQETTTAFALQPSSHQQHQPCVKRHFFVDDAERSASALSTKKRKNRPTFASSSSVKSLLHSEFGHNHRVKCFANFLCDAFGVDRLNSGCGVLDIGGGRGILSRELVHRGVAATVVDPRGWSSSLFLSLFVLYFCLRSSCFLNHSAPTPTPDQDRTLYSTLQCRFDAAFLSAPSTGGVVRDSSVLVSLHPHDVTEAIIDAAVALNKPFALVACCPASFNHVSGVDSYASLVQWLTNRHESIRHRSLGLGMDATVIFRL
jgi:hypothetical protein